MRPLITAFLEDILTIGLSLRVRVTGGSMAPFLRGGEIVTIKSVEADGLNRGDLIFFKDKYGNYVLHRVVRKRRGEDGRPLVQTKGDAVFSIDHPVAFREVVGKVCCIEKVSRSGGSKSIDMDSTYWRTVNYAFALFHLTSANIRSAVSVLTNATRAL